MEAWGLLEEHTERILEIKEVFIKETDSKLERMFQVKHLHSFYLIFLGYTHQDSKGMARLEDT